MSSTPTSPGMTPEAIATLERLAAGDGALQVSKRLLRALLARARTAAANGGRPA